MAEYKSADRRAWLQHYQQSGNVLATCRHFGISPTTFYKWRKRYDPDNPSKPLRSLPRGRKTKPSPKWTRDDLDTLAELDHQTDSRLGAGRLSQLLQKQYNIPWSRSTIGRMLSKVRRRCPICGERNGHDRGLRALVQDL